MSGQASSDAAARRSVFVAFFASGMLAVVWVARLPAIRDQLDLTDSQIGLVLLATALGSLAAMVFVGRLAVEVGSHTVLRFGLPLMAVSAVTIGLAASYPTVFATALVTGVFLGATDISMNAQAALIERRTDRRVMSTMHAGWSFGSAAGAGLAASMAAVDLGVLPTMLVASSIVMTASVVTSYGYQADAMSGMGQRDRRGDGRIRLPRSLILIGAVMTLALLIEGAVAGWTTLYLHDEFGATASLAALGYLVYELAMVTGRVLGDPARRRLGDRRAAWSGSLLAAVGLVIAAIAPRWMIAVPALMLVGVGQAVVVPVAFIAAGRSAPEVAASAIARVGSFGYAGLLAGPAVLGFVATASSMRTGFVALGLLAVIMAVAARASSVDMPSVRRASPTQRLRLPPDDN